MDEIRMKPGTIDKLIKKAGSSSEFARIMGVSRQRVNGWKQVQRIPSAYITKVHERFKIPIEDLI